MKKAIMGAVLAGTLAFGASMAAAETPGDAHNCAGAQSSALAKVLGSDFGATVSSFAKLRLVDNFGLRNCGNAKGKNPL